MEVERMSAIDKRVKEIIAEQLGVDESQVTGEASFMDDLGADSLDTVELVMALEEELDIEISDEDAEKIQTVQDAVDYITDHTSRRVRGEDLPLFCYASLICAEGCHAETGEMRGVRLNQDVIVQLITAFALGNR